MCRTKFMKIRKCQIISKLFNNFFLILCLLAFFSFSCISDIFLNICLFVLFCFYLFLGV